MFRLAIVTALLATFLAGCGGDDNPTTTPASGVCCLSNGTCVLTTQANCPGTWTSTGTCQPNPCPQPLGNTAPVACFTVDPTSIAPTVDVQVDAACSTDQQDSLTALQVRWDWESDGVWDTEFVARKTDSHRYTSWGTKTIRVEVRDSGGLTAQATSSVTALYHYLAQTSPENVLANLQMAYGERKIDEYKKLFTDDFIFVFNPADPIDPDHPNPPQWDLVTELEVTENMFADELVTKIELSSYSVGVRERVDSVEYRPRAWKARVDQANLQVYTRKEDGTLLALLVEGATEMFFFVEDPSKPSPVDGRPTWYIFRWEDQPTGSAKSEMISWGRLKSLYR